MLQSPWSINFLTLVFITIEIISNTSKSSYVSYLYCSVLSSNVKVFRTRQMFLVRTRPRTGWCVLGNRHRESLLFATLYWKTREKSLVFFYIRHNIRSDTSSLRLTSERPQKNHRWWILLYIWGLSDVHLILEESDHLCKKITFFTENLIRSKIINKLGFFGLIQAFLQAETKQKCSLHMAKPNNLSVLLSV